MHVSVRNPFLAVGGNSYKKKLAARIRRGLDECECRGETRATISEAMGFKTDTSLSKWATGSQEPSPENLKKLALATGLSLDWLVAERGPMFAGKDTDAIRLQVIGYVVDGTLDDETVRRLAAIESAEDLEESSGLPDPKKARGEGDSGPDDPGSEETDARSA